MYNNINLYNKARNVCVLLLLSAGALVATISANAQNLNNPNKEGPLGTQVNTLTGNFFVYRTDLYIPARMLDLDMSFYYNSFLFQNNYGYGNGWSFKYNIQYLADTLPGNKIIFWGDGREDKYDTITTGGYRTPNGFFTRLTQYEPGKLMLRELDGMRYFFDNSNHRKITRMDEPNGNFINFSYTDTMLTGITNAAGQSITLIYTNGKLATLVDAMATPTRAITYQYDNGNNLMNVKDPLNATQHFTYLINGPMKTMSDKNQNVMDIIYFPDLSTRELIGCNKRLSFSYDTASNTTIATDHLEAGNISTKYIYDNSGDLYWVKLVQGNCCGNITQYEYDAAGNQTKMTDANGNIATYTYDGSGNVLTATDAEGNTNRYTYTADFSKVKTYTDSKGFTYTMAYDAKGNILSITSPNGSMYAATYNAQGDIITSTDPKGNAYTYNYDAWGNPTTVSGPDGYSATLAFDARGNLLSYTNARGQTTTAAYDILSRMKKITDPINQELLMNYDAAGNMVSFTNQNNEISFIGYDASNRVASVTDAVAQKTKITYDGMDNILSITDPLNKTMQFAYDKQSNLKKHADKIGNNTQLERDANGNIISATLPNGQMYVYRYDRLNRLTEVSDNTGNMIKYSYDKNGNLLSYTDGNGGVTTATYDNLDRLIKMTDPLGNSSQYTYDNNNNVASITDREGRISTFTYDNRNRVASYTNNIGGLVTVGYDAANNATSITDENGNVTNYTYDVLNRRSRITYADGTYQHYSYDSKSNLITLRMADAKTINYSYDVLNRMITKTLPGGDVYTYGYDALSRIVTATNNQGTVTFNYDALNRITSETFGARTTNYAYDVAGRTQTTRYPDGTTILKSFDERNRLVQMTKGSVLIASYSYNNADQQTAKTFANGTNTQMQYDFAGRLISLNSTAASGTIQQSSFTYDKERNKTNITRNNNPALSETFTYDAKYRLTQYQRGTAQNSYTYDAAGNRTAANINGTPLAYTKNNLNQMLGVNGSSFTFDGKGNITYDGSYYKTYDGENRLVKDSASPTRVITYAYDAFGRRTRKTVNGQVRNYGYSGAVQIEELDGSQALLNKTIYNGMLSPVLQDNNGQSYYYHANELGSIEALTNSNGRLVESYRYDAFGKLLRFDSMNNPLAASIAGNRIGFTGQEYDSATASYRFFYRNYSPENGVFNQRDPLEYTDATSMYQYVGNNPANGVDVWGLQEQKPACEIDKLKAVQETNDFTSNLKSYGDLVANTSDLIYGKSIADLSSAPGGTGGLGTVLGFIDLAGKGVTNYNVQTSGKSTYMERVDANYDVAGSGLNLLAGIGAAVAGGPVGWSVGTATAVLGVGDYISTKATDKNIREHTEAPIVNQAKYLKNKEGFEQWAVDNGLAADIFDLLISKPGNLQQSEDYQFIKNLWDHDKQTTYLMWKKSQNLYLVYNNGCGGGTRIKVRYIYDREKRMWILVPIDPNLIVGPEGIEEKRWINAKDRMPYTIMFENDSTATARARYVRITSRVEPKQDATSLELGSVSFNNETFEIPPGLSSYYTRLDSRDSTGVFVDLTAGYDVINKQIFWELQSIDPITLIPPDDPLAGLLKLHDSTQPAYGNGFVTFRIKPVLNAQTLDSIAAKADIIFDENESILTNIHTNTLDAVAPTTDIISIDVTNQNKVTMSWVASDDAGGVGIDYYSIYIATDEVNYSLLFPEVRRTDTSFLLPPGGNYCFFVLATDRVGNTETLIPGNIQCKSIGSILPVTWLSFTGENKDKDNILQWATASEQNTTEFEIERSLTGDNFKRIASVRAAGNSSETTRYIYRDRRIDQLNSDVMYYRLKQVDKNNKFSYSGVVKLKYSMEQNKPSIVYPNPTPGLITVVSHDPLLIKTEAVITDINGRMVKRFMIKAPTQQIDLSSQPNGIYIIKLANNEILKVMKR